MRKRKGVYETWEYVKMKSKNRSYRYDVNRSSTKHGHKHNTNNKCHRKITFVYIKLYLSNLWSWMHEKV